jgi:hypothetical protein
LGSVELPELIVLTAHSCLVLSVGDSLSEILASEKGRARCKEFNSMCRKACAIQLSCNISWRRHYIESPRNHADEGSRLADAGLLQPGQTRTQAGLDRQLAQKKAFIASQSYGIRFVGSDLCC